MADTSPIKATGPAEIISRDPATGKEIGRAPINSAVDIVKALQKARAVSSAWGSLTYRERGRAIMRARRILLDESEEIAHLISRETGKPVNEAISMEIVPALDLMQYFAHATARLLRTRKVSIGQYGLMGRSSYLLFKPLGVVGIISPWNFPLGIPLGEVVMALMAGNGVILKPSELTPMTGIKIGEMFARAGLPDGLLAVVTGDGSTGAALVEADLDKIMFTGSVATGKRVAEAAARHLTPVVLELGGKDPLIVFEDAELETAASAVVWGAFANSGQACASVERCYVQENVASDFIARVVSETRKLHQDVGTAAESDIGPMSSEGQLRVVEEHVSEAINLGARAVCGGKRATHLSGPFYQPTILTHVNHSMRVMREETFGPVLPIMTFKTEEEAIHLANESAFGLTASVWTRNIARGRRVAACIEAGTVMVNEVLYTHGLAQTPWGGVKQSGIGRTHGKLGMLELVSPRHVHVNRISYFRDLWWFRYTPRAGVLFRGLAKRFATGSLLQTSLLFPQMVRRLFERRR